MRAEAAVEVDLLDGRVRCTRLRSEPPLTLRRTGDGVVHQVGTAGGPVGGDRLSLRVRVGPGAGLELRGVAATVALPGPGGEPSSSRVEAVVGEGGRLALVPGPVVAATGADHRAVTTVQLAAGASLLVREELVLGRHAEPPGSLHHLLVVDRTDEPLVRTGLAVGPAWPDSLGPAGLDGARALGTLLLVGPDLLPAEGDLVAPPGREGLRAGWFPVAPDAALLVALGEPAPVRAALDDGLARVGRPVGGFVST